MSQPHLEIAFLCQSGRIPHPWGKACDSLGWRITPVTLVTLRECLTRKEGIAAVVVCRDADCSEAGAEPAPCRGPLGHCPSLEEVRALAADLPLIVLEGSHSPLAAARSMVRGASLSLPDNLDTATLESILLEAQSSPWLSPPFWLSPATGSEDPIPELVGESAVMRRIKTQLRQWAELDHPGGGTLPILLHGESGTGKGLVARLAHNLGARRDGPFVTLHCHGRDQAELNEELFGTTARRNTGNRDRRRYNSALAKAQGGTLFLDEITDLSADTQARLVRILEQGTANKQNGRSSRKLDFRLVAATSANLPQLIARGRFRADLFHRIECLTMHLPPLRERGNDVVLLVRHFLGKISETRGGPPLHLTPTAMRWVRDHDWPGNARELRNALQRGAAHAQNHSLNCADLGVTRRRYKGPRSEDEAAPQARIRSDGTVRVDFDTVRYVDVEGIRRDLIRQALEATGGNQVESAHRLGMSRNSIRYAIKKYGLDDSNGNRNGH